jgi:streptogramin lyase
MPSLLHRIGHSVCRGGVEIAPVDRGALMHNVGRLDPDTGKVVEYPFPHAENSLRDFFMDDNGRMWFGSPANDKV